MVDHPVTRLVARLLVLAAYAWAGLALMAGQDLLTNPVFGFVFVWVWVGLVPISLLLGGFWRATNPLRTIHDGLSRLAGTDPDQGLVRLPARIGVWPAAVALFAFAWLELVQPDRTTLAVLRVWALAWLVLGVIGAVVFGRRWIGAADPFETYAETVAQRLTLGPGGRPAAAGQPAGPPEPLACAARQCRRGRGPARQHRLRQLRQHQLLDHHGAELGPDHRGLGHAGPADHDRSSCWSPSAWPPPGWAATATGRPPRTRC